jgi:hypothetical protein
MFVYARMEVFQMTSQPGDTGQRSFTIDQLCRRNAISRSFFYKLKAAGRGPRLTDFNRVTQEAEADWLREREAAASGNDEAA